MFVDLLEFVFFIDILTVGMTFFLFDERKSVISRIT